MNDTEKQAGAAQLYRRVVEPSLRNLKLDFHHHHHSLHLHTAFHPETGHCRLGSASGDHGRPNMYPSDGSDRQRHGLLPKIGHTHNNARLHPQPESTCPDRSSSSPYNRKSLSISQRFHSVSHTKELPLLTVRSNDRGITLLPRHAAHRSISRSSQHRYLGTTKAFKDISLPISDGDGDVPKSEQVQRFQEEKKILDHTRHLKRVSETATYQHRVDRMYYMCGSKVSLRKRYSVDDDGLERLRALSMAQSQSRASRSAHSRTGYDHDDFTYDTQPEGEVTIDLLTGTVSASSSDQNSSEVRGALVEDKTRDHNDPVNGTKTDTNVGSLHPAARGKTSEDREGCRPETSAKTSHGKFSDFQEIDPTQTLSESSPEASDVKGRPGSHSGDDVSNGPNASNRTTFVTQRNGNDIDVSHGVSHHSNKEDFGNGTPVSGSISHSGNEEDTGNNKSNSNIADSSGSSKPVAESVDDQNITASLELNEKTQSSKHDDDLMLLKSASKDMLTGLSSSDSASGDTLTGRGNVSHGLEDAVVVSSLTDNERYQEETVDELDDERIDSIDREEMEVGDEQEQTDTGERQDQAENEQVSAGDTLSLARNGNLKNEQEIGFGIILESTPYTATKQEIYSNTSFENPSLKQFQDLATISGIAGHSGHRDQGLSDQSGSSNRQDSHIDNTRSAVPNEMNRGCHSEDQLTEDLERVGRLPDGEMNAELLGGRDGAARIDWDNGVYAQVLNDGERAERDEMIAKRKSERKNPKREEELRQERKPLGDDGKVSDAKRKLNLADVYSFFTARQRMIFQRKFQELDVDGNGKVTLAELTKRMAEGASEENLKELVKVFDLNKDRTIDRREFVTVAALNDKLRGQEIESETAPLRLNLKKLGLHITAYKEIFELVDKNISGRLTLDEIMFIVSVSVGAEIGTDREIVDYIFKTVDVNGDGSIDFVEFLSFIPFFLKLHSEMVGRPASFEDVVAANKAVKEALQRKQAEGKSGR